MSEFDNNFLIERIKEDTLKNKDRQVITRFPPEPNAYLHIGHARAIITNFTIAKMFNGYTNLRFDDTNPVSEDQEFVEAIQEDIKWLGFNPANVYYGSDYFEETYDLAILLIKKGLAYVCDLSVEEIQKYRGDFVNKGVDSPFRNRSIQENLELFENMKNGVYPEGSKTLRAKIDMASSNLNLRDPVLYRILKVPHHRQLDKWCIYPMYDFAHPIQDSIENISHSLCSLEYDNHRPLYDWVVINCELKNIPTQIEFGRLSITNTIMSKRYLKALVASKKVKGYDDPRMPTLVGLRRRGYTNTSIIKFITDCGLSRTNVTVESSALEACIRDDLKLSAKRLMAITDPLKVTIINYEDDKVESLSALYNSENEELGSRDVLFSKHLYIEREDFCLEKPNKHYKRLALGVEVRLMHAYFIKAVDVVYEDGKIVEVLATYDPLTKSGSGFNERKPNGTIQFLSEKNSKSAVFNLFEPLLNDDESLDLLDRVNEDSWIIKNGFIEDGSYSVYEKFQFVRDGYYSVDPDTNDSNYVFNRITSLKSSIK